MPKFFRLISSNIKIFTLASLFSISLKIATAQSTAIESTSQLSNTNSASTPMASREICEFFTAHTLKSNQWKLGTSIEFASSDNLQISNDVLSTLFGVLGLGMKLKTLHTNDFILSTGLRVSYADQHTMIWGKTKESFDSIHASILQPSLHLTFPFANRMQWHQLFAIGFGTAEVELSSDAQKRLRESKEDKNEELSTSNQESESSKISRVAERTLQVGAIASGLSDIYQSSFEYRRDSGHRVLFTIKHQRTEIESLKASVTSFTLAHHWFGKHMNLRLGFGVQYSESSGQDLDGENLSSKEWQPANDVNLYWVF